MQQVRPDRGRLVIHALLFIYAAVLVYILLGLIFQFNPSADVFFGLSFALLFFTLGQALYEMGIKKAVLFLIITGTVGFLAEVLGTNSGFPFGEYYYTNFLGSKFLGVPVVGPLVWFVIAYLSYSIVAGNLTPPSSHPNFTGSSLFAKTVLLAAFGAVAWDFMIDPMFSSYGYWVWTGQFLPLPELRRHSPDQFCGLVCAGRPDDRPVPLGYPPVQEGEQVLPACQKQQSRFSNRIRLASRRRG